MGRIVKEDSQETYRAELYRDTKPIMIAPVFGNKGTIGIVEMEVASELVEGRFA